MTERLMTQLEGLGRDEPTWIDPAHAGMSTEEFHEFFSRWRDSNMGPEGFRLLQAHQSSGSRMIDRACVIRTAD